MKPFNIFVKCICVVLVGVNIVAVLRIVFAMVVASTVCSATCTVELRRTPCLGFCPAYTVKVSSNGLIEYHGDFALVRGDQRSHISPLQASLLISTFLLYDFPSYAGLYDKGNEDFPGSFTCLTVGTTQKCVAVTFSLERRLDPPPYELYVLNGLIDEAAQRSQWIGTQEQLLEKSVHPGKP